MPNGHIGELQLHVKPMLKAKAQAHKQYETMRSITAKMEKEKRKIMTPEESQDWETAKKASLKIYNKAWDESNSGSSENKESDPENKEMKTSSTKRRRLTARGEESIVYYNFNDLPAYVKRGQVPMKMIDGKPHPVYDFFKFDHAATRITEQEYKNLLKETK
jgi:hypothetical protein